jgi:hypothetical protein
MVDRIQINSPIYMRLDGQWQVVLSGTVCDVSDSTVYTYNPAAHLGVPPIVLSPGEPAGSLASHGYPTPVRNVKTR